MDAAGYIYPNEYALVWSVLIVLYPYLSGIAAGAFAVAMIQKLFDIDVLRPLRRVALLTSVAFLAIAPLPLVLHLHHPTRSMSIMFTPNPRSAMAVFGFVYLIFLVFSVLLSIWLEWRGDLARLAASSRGPKALLYKLLTLGATRTDELSLAIDRQLAYRVYQLGLPLVILLPGYVGFIFGSIKANAWWSSPLIPVVFVVSALVSGAAMVLVLGVVLGAVRRAHVHDEVVRALGKLLLVALVIAFTLEALDTVHRFYTAEEYFHVVDAMINQRMFDSVVTMQVLLGGIVPIALLGLLLLFDFSPGWRRALTIIAAICVLIGVFAVRWNVVMGGQFFSRSLHGFRPFHLEWGGREGGYMALLVGALPFVLFAIAAWLLPTPTDGRPDARPTRAFAAPPWLAPAALALLIAPMVLDAIFLRPSTTEFGPVAAPIPEADERPGVFRPAPFENVVPRDPPLEPEPEPEPPAVEPAPAEGSAAHGEAGTADGSALGDTAEGSAE